MQLVDGKSMARKNVEKKNRESVRKYYEKNPKTTILQCAKDLGLSWPTVKRHAVFLVKEYQSKIAV